MIDLPKLQSCKSSSHIHVQERWNRYNNSRDGDWFYERNNVMTIQN